MAFSVGVDLGTTYVAAATSRAGRPEMVSLGDEAFAMPAAVFQPPEPGALLTGDAAMRRLIGHPDCVARDFKRKLGDPNPVIIGGVPHPVAELMAALLRDVLATVGRVEGTAPGRVLLTHPANWGPFRRGLFDEVPHLAGLAEFGTVPEPVAAAVHYASSRDLVPGDLIAVYDLGGGTFDATVLQKQDTGIAILTSEGVERLGGIDFDDAIMTHVNVATGGALDGLNLSDRHTVAELARLREECVRAKLALSVDTETTVTTFLAGRHLDVTLTRAEFEGMIRAPLESTLGALDGTLHRAGVAPAQLSAILLVGGSSRIPLVHHLVAKEFGAPVLVDTQPKNAVALGAATLADASAGSSPPRPPVQAPPQAPAPQAPAPPPPGRSGRHRLLAALAVVVLLAVLGLGGWLLFGSRSGPSPNAAPSPAPTPAPPPAPAQSVAVPHVGPTIPVGPTSASGFVAVSRDGREAYVANRTAGVVTIVDTATDRVTATVPVPAGPPQSLTFSLDGKTAYISVYNAEMTIAAVSVLDTATNTIKTTIPMQARPFVSAVTRDGTALWVPDHDSGTVAVVDLATNTVTSTIKVAPNPHWVTFSWDGSRAYTANHESNLVSVLDTASQRVLTTVPVGTSPHSLALNPRRRVLAVADYDAASVSIIDTDTNQVATVPVGRNPNSVAWAPDGDHLYVTNEADNTVSVIDGATDLVTANLPVGKTPTSISVAPDGRTAWVADLDDGALTRLDLTSP